MSENDLKWYETEGNESDVVISSRVRLARNLRRYPFPTKLNPNGEKALLSDVSACTGDLEAGERVKFFYCGFQSLSETEKLAMVERHIVSLDFAVKEANTGLIISEDEAVSIMINEEDHLRIQTISGGMNMQEVWEKANDIDDILDKKLGFAFDDRYGYLTSCPTNVGTGLRASYMMFLPALTHTGNIRRISDELAGYGIALRGIYGEGSGALGDIYQISNQRTLGNSEKEIIDSLDNISSQIVSQERKARESLFASHFDELEDQIYRSYGILKYAKKISSADAMTLLGQIKLGTDIGIIKLKDELQFYKMIINIQRANLQMTEGQVYGNMKRDTYRAEYIRTALPDLAN